MKAVNTRERTIGERNRSELYLALMLLILKDLKSCLRFLTLSFWLVQNLSSLTEGFPASGNDNHWNRVRYEFGNAYFGMNVNDFS